jgi:hypothetical protein
MFITSSKGLHLETFYFLELGSINVSLAVDFPLKGAYDVLKFIFPFLYFSLYSFLF